MIQELDRLEPYGMDNRRPLFLASGLRLVQDILDGVDDIYFARLNSHDVVRHRLVSDIVNAYEAYDARNRDGAGRPQRVTSSGRRDDRGAGQPDRRGSRGRRAQ